MIVKLTLFIPYTRGDLASMTSAVETASKLLKPDTYASNVVIIKSDAREGSRPTD